MSKNNVNKNFKFHFWIQGWEKNPEDICGFMNGNPPRYWEEEVWEITEDGSHYWERYAAILEAAKRTGVHESPFRDLAVGTIVWCEHNGTNYAGVVTYRQTRRVVNNSIKKVMVKVIALNGLWDLYPDKVDMFWVMPKKEVK